MKIEIGESLILSWLRHEKKCQLVQMNWKPSVASWTLMNEEVIHKIMDESKDKFGSEIFKKTSLFKQLIQQAEIDVLGISYENRVQHIYAVDVAFHEAGLNYGSKDETVMRVVKKLLRTAMCISGYFGYSEGDIIFASPKINNSVFESISPQIEQVKEILRKNGINFKVRLITNGVFGEEILKPVLAATSLVADTSELFMRSIQLYNMFADKEQNGSGESIEQIEVEDDTGLPKMKIGKLVRSTLTKMFRDNEVTPEEVKLMQTEEYSKKTFGIQFPLLQKKSINSNEKPPRYWGGAVEINGDKYFICSEWFEVPQNNDRLYFMEWLELKNSKIKDDPQAK
jgi:hypothetical protein